MRLPRFSPMDDRSLKRFRFQAIFIGIVWGIVAVIRTVGSDHSPVALLITVAVWIVFLGFFVASALAFTEVRRRKAESA